MARVHLESVLECNSRIVWTALLLSETLQKVSRPLVIVVPLKNQTLPPHWEQGAMVRFRLLLLGVIPIGVRTVSFEQVDDEAMQIQTREYDVLAKRWDHRMQVVSIADGRCRYSDEVEIHAGLFTFALWLFASLYYRHRQRRWRYLARRLQSAARSSSP